MKLKTIVGVCVAACATMLMAMAVSAATEIYFDTPNLNTGVANEVGVPIYLKSNDSTVIDAFQLKIGFDSSKMTLEENGYENPFKSGRSDDGVMYANVDSATPNVVEFGWTTATASGQTFTDQVLIGTLYFTLTDTSATAADILKGLSATAKVVSLDGERYSLNDLATYISFPMAKSYIPDEAKPWITGMQLLIDGTPYPVKYYDEDGDNYVFTIKLKPTTAKAKTTIGTAVLQAGISATNDADPSEYTTLKTWNNLDVQYLN